LVQLDITYNTEFGYDFVYVYDGASSTAAGAQLVQQLTGPGDSVGKTSFLYVAWVYLFSLKVY